MVNTLLQSIDKGEITLGIFIDFKKAFDTINHSILSEKLEYYGIIRGIVLQWFQNYLSNRSQVLCYKEEISSSIEGLHVARISPGTHTLFFLFIIIINGYFQFRLFADVSNIFHTFPKGKKIDMNDVNEKLKEVQNWCIVNKLTIHLKKTNYMVIKRPRRSIAIEGVLSVSQTVIDRVHVAVA